MIVVLASLAGGLGALARHEVTRLLSGRDRFPVGTWVVNLSGSFLLGVVVGVLGADARAIWGTGFCSGYTTFSTFAVETVELRHSTLTATAYVVTSVVGGTIAAALGIMATGSW